MKPQEQTYSKSRRLKNQIKAVVTNPYNIIVLIAVVLLVYLIVLPLLDMIATTFELAQRDIRAVGGGKAGDFTLYYWQRLLASELSWTMLIKPLINSLVIGVCVSVCAILLGSILACCYQRVSLNDVLPGEEQLRRIEAIADPYAMQPQSIMEEQESRRELYDGLKRLTQREQTYLLYRYGFTDGEEHPLIGTAIYFHLTKGRAKKTEEQAMDNLWLELPWWFV